MLAALSLRTFRLLILAPTFWVNRTRSITPIIGRPLRAVESRLGEARAHEQSRDR